MTKVVKILSIDGGVYANNPAMCGYVEAVSAQSEPCKCLVVSLGTGELTRPIRYDDAKDWGWRCGLSRSSTSSSTA